MASNEPENDRVLNIVRNQVVIGVDNLDTKAELGVSPIENRVHSVVGFLAFNIIKRHVVQLVLVGKCLNSCFQTGVPDDYILVCLLLKEGSMTRGLHKSPPYFDVCQ